MTLWLDILDGGRIEYIAAGGRVTRALIAGEGPLVVCLHGTGGHAEAFARNVVPLASEGFRVAAIDMIGHGFSAKPPNCRYTIEDFVDHLFDFVEAVGASDVQLLGESLGGWVALRAALRHPERVRSVINITGGGMRPVPPTDAELEGWSRLESLSSRVRGTQSWEDWRNRMNWLVRYPDRMTDEVVAVRARIYDHPAAREAASAIYKSVFDMLRQHTPGAVSGDELATLECPVLYAWSDHNPTTPAAVAQAAHDLTPHSEYVLFEDCAHWLQWEMPDTFNRLAATFLQANR